MSSSRHDMSVYMVVARRHVVVARQHVGFHDSTYTTTVAIVFLSRWDKNAGHAVSRKQGTFEPQSMLRIA